MIVQHYVDMLGGKSVIRELAEWSAARGAEIGYDNVFDYSLGNPSVPCPPAFTAAMVRLLQTQEPVALHGYSPTLTIPSVRQAVADNLNKRFGTDYTADYIFMTSGAAGALAHALRCVAAPGQTVLTIAPFFPEYKPYVEGAGLTLKVVPPRVADFQIDFDALEAMLTEDVAAVLIDTPNNPSGIAYSEETLRRLADMLRAASAKWGHHIFLLSDEPYREIVFGGVQQHPAVYYDDTLTCYSFSKSLSLPGERIGYLVIPDEMDDSRQVFQAATISNRVLGCVNAPSLMQRVIKRCVDAEVDVAAYDRNRNLLYNGLLECGFSCIKPEGAFYLFVKSPAEDEKEFCEVCKQYNVLVVPGSSFACPGYVRIAYCVSYEQIERSLPAFRKIAAHYHLG